MLARICRDLKLASRQIDRINTNVGRPFRSHLGVKEKVPSHLIAANVVSRASSSDTNSSFQTWLVFPLSTISCVQVVSFSRPIYLDQKRQHLGLFLTRLTAIREGCLRVRPSL